jgi:hypothetical protein
VYYLAAFQGEYQVYDFHPRRPDDRLRRLSAYSFRVRAGRIAHRQEDEVIFSSFIQQPKKK